MTILWYKFTALCIEPEPPQQPAINNAAAQFFVSPLATPTLSLLLSVAIMLVIRVCSVGMPHIEQIITFSWRAVLDGMIGLLFLGDETTLEPITGAVVFFTCLIVGQMFSAVRADAVSAFGIQERAGFACKLFGLALAFAGVILVRWG